MRGVSCCAAEPAGKLVFSGDTRPSRRLCQAGAGATLLIHEATFEPAMHAQVRCQHILRLDGQSVSTQICNEAVSERLNTGQSNGCS